MKNMNRLSNTTRFLLAMFMVSIGLSITLFPEQAQAGIVPPVAVSCLKGDAVVTCGKVAGTYDVTLTLGGSGGVIPTTAQISVLTPGVTIVSPASSYPVIGGQVKLTLAGATPGQVVDFQMDGSSTTPDPETGLSICCNGKISITIPKDLDCQNKKQVDLAIKKTGATSPAPEVNGYSFNLAVTNVGTPFNGTNAITVTDVVPAGMTFNSATSPDWLCATLPALAGSTMTCTFTGVGPVSTGQALSPIAIAATANGSAPFPPFENCAVVGTLATSPYADTNAANNKSCVTVTKVTPPSDKFDISMKKTWTKGATELSGSFTMAVKNEGPNAISSVNAVKITDPIPAGITITAVNASSIPNWTCLPTTLVGPATMSCTYIGALPVASGASLPNLQLDATLAAPLPPKTVPAIYNNCADASLTGAGSAAVVETNSTNNHSCAQTEVIVTNCMMDGTCPPPPPLTCESDVLLVVDRSASILDASSINTALNNFMTPMKNKGGHVEVLYFSSKNYPFSSPTEKVLPQTLMGAPAIPALTAASGGYTNWDNALHMTSTEASSPKFVIFITDGEPTAYDDASGNEVPSLSNPTIAANEAAPWINTIRMGGSKLLTIGFGPVSTQGYLEATFGGTVGSGLSADIIKVTNESSLASTMNTLGRQLCGTLNLAKSPKGSISVTIPKNTASMLVTGDLKYGLSLTNNSAAAINTIVVEDVFNPVVQAGMPSDAAFGAPTVVGTPSSGTASWAGSAWPRTLTWAIPSLAPGATATMDFKTVYSGTHADTAYKLWWVPNVAQVKSALTDSYSTSGNLASYVPSSVLEPDEATAQDYIQIQKDTDIVYTDPCATPSTAPASCFLLAEKKRVVAEGTCAAGQSCKYQIKVLVKASTGVPAGATVSIKDILTDDGSAVFWPATFAITSSPSGTVCTPAPTLAGFTCSVPYPAVNTYINFDVNVSIPAGTSGVIKNCIGAQIANAGSPYNTHTAQAAGLGLSTYALCAQHTIAPTTAKIINPATTTLSVIKEAIYNGNHITSQSFPIAVSCGNEIAAGIISDGAAPYVQTNIPVGTSCAVQEEAVAPEIGLCADGETGTWTTTYSPAGAVVMSPNGETITVVNTLSCEKTKDTGLTTFSVQKEASYNGEPITDIVFPMTVSCGKGDAQTLNVQGGQSQTVSDLPVGTTCSVIEGDIPNTGLCPKGTTEQWDTSYSPADGSGTTSANSSVVVRVSNLLSCRKIVVEGPKCDGITAQPGKDGSCVCLYRNMSKTSSASCGCGKGSKFIKGKGCVPIEPICKNGTKFNPARGRCEPLCQKGQTYNVKKNRCDTPPPVCKRGEQFNPKTGRCVAKEPFCRPPFKYNAKINKCVQVIKPEGRGCPFPLVPNPLNGRCINPGVIIDLFNDGGPSRPPKDTGPVDTGPKVCRDGDVVVPCR